MGCSKEESAILARISAFVKKIQEFLTEAGCSQKQIAAYFGRIVFQSTAELAEGETTHSLYKKQIEDYLKRSLAQKKSLRVSLVHLLETLEIENGKIELYERELEEQKATSKVLEKRRELFNEQFSYRPKRLFDMNMLKQDTSDGNKSIVKDLEQIKNFERELQESLLKTKLLKRMIQQKIEEDVEDPFSRCFNGFQKLLSLESSG